MAIFSKLLSRLKRRSQVAVAILDPHGDELTQWTVGSDVSHETVREYFDESTNQLHAVRVYRAGRPELHVCSRETWLQVKTKGEDATHQRPQDEENRIIGSVLVGLGKCRSDVLVGSPQLDKRYTGDLVINSKFLGEHLSSLLERGEFRGHQHQAGAKALIMWLRGADIIDIGASHIPLNIYELIKNHVPELVNTDAAQVRCRQCRDLYRKVKVEDVPIDDSDIYVSWKTNWMCPRGHILFSDFREVYMSISD